MTSIRSDTIPAVLGMCILPHIRLNAGDALASRIGAVLIPLLDAPLLIDSMADCSESILLRLKNISCEKWE